MVGEQFSQIVKLVGLRNSSWINIHALLHDDTSENLWIYGENLSSFEDGRVAFIHTNGKIYGTSDTNSKHSFACGYRQDKRTAWVTRLEAFRFENKTSAELHAAWHETESCFNRSMVTTKSECAYRCHLNNMCRSFYYNDQQKICIYTLYVDSLLTLSDWTSHPPGWKRYARPSWSLSRSEYN
ncbi:hypothetical protein FGIG_09397 [Fasciola gigantica]|uniref:Apple domain-containing protein n=1 Tax=Fasciola gigantica TaxID=46835 RepID=A0A504YX45_FASGI|nr:hypothetical protein FGIG_09397 [Fasciola gigantica]